MITPFLVVSTSGEDMEYMVSKRVIVTFDVIIGVVSANILAASFEDNVTILEFEHCPNTRLLLIFEYPFCVPSLLLPTLISALIIFDSPPPPQS